MTKARQKPSTSTQIWEVYHLGRTGKRLGTVEAVDADQGLQKAVEEFDIQPRDVPRTLVCKTG
jgi:hypothetical protein